MSILQWGSATNLNPEYGAAGLHVPANRLEQVFSDFTAASGTGTSSRVHSQHRQPHCLTQRFGSRPAPSLLCFYSPVAVHLLTLAVEAGGERCCASH
jgi:hypothetical protein